jgi:hypothetical protein
MENFGKAFKRATGYGPYPYQDRLAADTKLPQLLDMPTGLGKTGAVVLAWLWRRRYADESQPTDSGPPRLLPAGERLGVTHHSNSQTSHARIFKNARNRFENNGAALRRARNAVDLADVTAPVHTSMGPRIRE